MFIVCRMFIITSTSICYKYNTNKLNPALSNNTTNKSTAIYF